MNLDTLLTDTFLEHEHLAPNDADVLAAVHRRVDSHGVGFARPLAIAASVVVVAATAGGAVLLGRHDGATPRTGTAAATALHQTSATAKAPTRIPALTMPFDLGYLPDGTVRYVARRINVGAVSDTAPPSFDGEYLLNVTGSSELNVDVTQVPGGLGGVRFKSGPGRATTVNGRPGVQSANAGGPGGFELYFRDADAKTMYVNVAAHTGAASAQRLTTIGHKIAAGVRFPGTATVAPQIGVGYVPTGLSVRAFDVEQGPSGLETSYDLGTTSSQDGTVFISTNSLAGHDGTPGRRVQGYRTRVLSQKGYRALLIATAGRTGVVQVTGRVSLADLYRVADGLILPAS